MISPRRDLTLILAVVRMVRRAARSLALLVCVDGLASYRAALQVRTRDLLPQDWAATQTNLGTALDELAGRSEGPRAAELLHQAVVAHRAALQVRTRDQLPQDWARTQNNLGIALQMYLAKHEYRAGLEQLTGLMKEKHLTDSPQLVALAYVLRIMGHRASGEGGQAAGVFDALVAHLERQPEPFRLPWSFAWLRRDVAQSKDGALAAHREFLLGLFDAASEGSRDGILAGLRQLRKQ